ncbi:procathepsin L-like [Rhineura floridana]|uniref:procathepsin L-like n=1 Tax=Rhineura floridana TaxID=261503 RepID=UPI002AC875C8|nr:procathepsin L-like [Rhineura floridana]XP_061456726.1 procathepsin L-like [Rhineura floridana]XP_061456727.1 procathepsin L-like [Rhineura floridana]
MLPISVVTLTRLVLLTTFSAALDPILDMHWNHWRGSHHKIYHLGEENHRREIWESNLKMIEQHNSEAGEAKHNYTMAMNEFGDWTNEEFNEKMNGYRPDPFHKVDNNIALFKESDTLVTEACVDWRYQGYVTPVKNQGSCGSCWAFSATGALEGLHFKKTHQLVSLSEQNLVDCCWPQGDQGCGGGWPASAFHYVMGNRGINSERTYPYEGKNGPCRFQPWDRAATCSSYTYIPQGNEGALEQAVGSVGPVSVAVDASDFQFYHQGIYSNSKCGTQLNHAVLAIGYCTDVQQGPYWILKNSWGPTWGENGYMRLAKGFNLCGVANAASYPF